MTENDQKFMHQIIENLNQNFQLRNFGDLHYFLGLQLHKNHTGIYLPQSKNVINILLKLGMTICKSVPTPYPAKILITLELILGVTQQINYHQLIC